MIHTLILAFCALAAPDFAPLATPYPDLGRPLGYVIRVGGQKPVTLVRKGGHQPTVLTAKLVEKRVLLYEGDDFVVPSGSFVNFFDGPRARRKPALAGSQAGPVGQFLASGPRPRRTYATRPLSNNSSQTTPATTRLIAKDGFFDVPVRGPVTLGWVAVGRDRPESIRLDVPGRPSATFAIEAEVTRQLTGVTIMTSDRIADHLRKTVQPGGEFTVTLSMVAGSPQAAKFTRLNSKSSDSIVIARNSFLFADRNSPEWFDKLDNYIYELDEVGCATQAALLVVDWWLTDSHAFAAKAALSGVALDFELSAIDKLIGVHGVDTK